MTSNEKKRLLNNAADKVLSLLTAQECALSGVVFLWPDDDRECYSLGMTADCDREKIRKQALKQLTDGGIPVGIIRFFDLDETTIKVTSYQIVPFACMDNEVQRLAPIAIERCLQECEIALGKSRVQIQ